MACWKANEWLDQHGWLRGANFTSSTAINQPEMWQAETFDETTIDRELGYAEASGSIAARLPSRPAPAAGPRRLHQTHRALPGWRKSTRSAYLRHLR
jgi:hypothetical protein